MSRTDARTANLLGALATTLAGGTTSDDAALITLHNYAEGHPLDLLRGALGLSHPATVRLADRLQARGLVKRRRSGADGRSVGLWLTATGRAAACAARHARAEALGPTLAALDPSERRTLAALMDKMLAAQTTSSERSRWICRLCDPDACGHPAPLPGHAGGDGARAVIARPSSSALSRSRSLRFARRIARPSPARPARENQTARHGFAAPSSWHRTARPATCTSSPWETALGRCA